MKNPRQDGEAICLAILAGRKCTHEGIELVLVNRVAWATGENLLLAPVGHGTKRVAGDKIAKRLFVVPFAGDEVRARLGDIVPQRRFCMAISRVESVDHPSELLFEVRLFARDNNVIHSNSNHIFYNVKRVKWQRLK